MSAFFGDLWLKKESVSPVNLLESLHSGLLGMAARSINKTERRQSSTKNLQNFLERVDAVARALKQNNRKAYKALRHACVGTLANAKRRNTKSFKFGGNPRMDEMIELPAATIKEQQLHLI